MLHLGAGPHRLPSPWENFDSEVDIARPLPFPDLSAEFQQQMVEGDRVVKYNSEAGWLACLEHIGALPLNQGAPATD